jgi:multidrug efflux pump
MPSKPFYRKVNPADAPIMILSLTSASMSQGQLYDAASTVVSQKLSQLKGVGEIEVGGWWCGAGVHGLSPRMFLMFWER